MQLDNAPGSAVHIVSWARRARSQWTLVYAWKWIEVEEWGGWCGMRREVVRGL